MKKYIVTLVSGEKKPITAARYEVNESAGTIDFFDDENGKITEPLFFVQGVASVEEDKGGTFEQGAWIR